jgi:hypothetical protein
MAISNQEIQQWINQGGLDDLTQEVASASPYATDTMNGASLHDTLLDISSELKRANELKEKEVEYMYDMNSFLLRIATSLES